MILEPYGIEVVDFNKVEYSWFNNTCRIGKDQWVQFFPDDKKNFKSGKFGTVLTNGDGHTTADWAGDFVRVGKVVFLREYKENFYA